jgi:hypothetical protein
MSVNRWETTESYLTGKMNQEILSNTGYFIPAGGSSTPKCIYGAAENMHDQLISFSVPSCADWELGAQEGKLCDFSGNLWTD